MTRTHAMDLPTTEEIKQMMEMEAERSPTSNIVFADFSVAQKWFAEVDVKTNIFDLPSIEEVNEEVVKIKPTVVANTLNKTPECVGEVENYLGEEDTLIKTDVAFVFGGRTLLRAEKAAELYLGGWVKKILMVGSSPNYTAFFDVPEAIAFKKKAMEMGVPERDILVEAESINIASNVRGGLNKLDELQMKYDSLAQVISWYANRRAWCTLKKYLDPKVKLVRVNSGLPGDSLYKPGEWYKTQAGIEIIFNEFIKMKHQSLTERA